MQFFMKAAVASLLLMFGGPEVAKSQQRVGPSAVRDFLMSIDREELRQLAQQLDSLQLFEGDILNPQADELQVSVLHAYIIYSANGGERHDMLHWQSLAGFVYKINEGKLN